NSDLPRGIRRPRLTIRSPVHCLDYTQFNAEANMSERQYPNESKEYRDARDSLLIDEQELVDKVFR
ncbi:MAG TPA: hypothetical protein VIV27_04855, partial [Halioglobus sp.]